RLDRPVLLGLERGDLGLALAHQADRDRLDPAGGQAALDLVPQDRADLVADDAVEDPARLLRVGLVHVDLARRRDRRGDALLGDLVDQHAPQVRVDVLDLLGDVPRDRLALAIGVGREVDGLVLARSLADLGDDLLLALDDLVDRLEVAFQVDADLRLRQIADVADRRLHGEAGAQVLADRARLGRRLDDDQRGAGLDLAGLPGVFVFVLGIELGLELLHRLARRLGYLGGLAR